MCNMLKAQVKLTVVTVSYNAARTIEQTILSVVNQSYPNIEYIIIDGGSTDGTVDIIKKYQNKISYWISEPDKGIYDAMNKGIDIASGDYIQFLGADDCLVAETTIHDIVQELMHHVDCPMLSAPIWIVDEKLRLQKLLLNKISKKYILEGRMVPHPGMFVRIDVMKKYKFNIENLIISDYEFLLKYTLDEGEIISCSNPVVYFSNAGMSSNSHQLAYEYGILMKKLNMRMNEKFLLSLRGKKNLKIYIKIILEYILKKIGLWKYALIQKGWEKHTCSNKGCRWCNRKV